MRVGGDQREGARKDRRSDRVTATQQKGKARFGGPFFIMTTVFKEHDAQTGITSIVHEVENRTVIQKQYDASPFLETAAEQRAVTAGERWGEMRHVGFIPMAELATMMRQDGRLDQKRCLAWLKANPALVTFDKLLKK